ncbi:MAG: ABC transporter ATP-binding protein [Atribacterota bacterium]|nr:ABC transporter ATP-binding protein [Atribacterota bacterium]MDD4895453.1 ABC transporter ATP-binding protein [Atribacterota bacterium]MDD5637630.1 ABC transporter ATP-binding protein [Atribacterota bacterium]
MKQVLQVKDLSSGYGNITILRDINFQVEENEVVAIIGSNGAGKTTLLKTISNLIPATAGDIIFQGKDIVKYPPHIISQLGIAHVQEGGKLFMNMTVYENLLMGTYKNRKYFQKDVLEDIYQIFPILKKREKQLAKTLSGGEKQMLAIGRSLASQPKFIMLDEPSLGLAPKLVDEIYYKLSILKKKGLTILLIEQNINYALQIAERAYVLENGKIVMEGNSKELLKDEHIKKHYLGI